MLRFADIPVKGKLVLATVTATAAALLLSYIATVGLAIWRQRHTAARTLAADADIVGANCRSSILFRNASDAQELLAFLQRHHEIVSARIYLANGTVFAESGTEPAAVALPEEIATLDSLRFDRDELSVCRPIMNGTETLGSLCVRAKLGDRWALLREYALISGAVMLVSLIISIFLALRLQRFVTTPLNQLAEAMQTVTHDQNYVIYSEPRPSQDEIGKLVTGFSLMLEEIRRRDRVIRSRETMFEGLFEQGPDAVVVVNPHGRIDRVNARAEQIFGYRRAELIGQPLVILVPERYRQRHGDYLLRYFQAPTPREMGTGLELFGRRKDGTEFPVDIGLAPMRMGPDVLALAVVSDITDRKAAEEALRQSEARLRSILDNSPAVIFMKDTAGRYLFINRYYEQVFHRTNAEMVGKTAHAFHPKTVADHLEANDRQVLSARRPLEFEEQVIQDGVPHTYLSVKFPLETSDGEMYAVCCISRDITERRRLQQQVEEISSRELSRMGQDLHDGLCQHLVGTAFVANRLEKLLTGKDATGADEARQVADLLDQAITQARGFARELYPVRLEGDGLAAALEEMAVRLGNRFNVDCIFAGALTAGIDQREAATNLYRIAQEAVTNAIKHAQAREVVIELRRADDAVLLRVRDDGIGLPDNWVHSPGMGMHLMRYRASLIGATLDIARAPDRGTIVVCVWNPPLPPENTTA